MRLHSLEVTAFGPFAATVRVDFEPLNDAGLFLLAGNTGSGKSSILDAVCFALFGQVPGDRQHAKRLRSDHAADGVAPEVRLEVTASGRRFLLVRSPEWQRPKRRGEGMTREHAKVVVSELVDGSWTTHTTRIDEAAELIRSVVGMDVHQFTQVAMLPQGRFQTFLRAGSEERKHVLESLFGTARFRDMERWLVEHRRTLLQQHNVGQARTRTVVDRIAGVVAAEDESVPPDSQEWLTWSQRLLEGAGRDADAADRRAESAAEERDAAAAGLTAARTLDQWRGRGHEATSRLDTLAAEAEQIAVHRASLDEDERARTVLPVLDHLARAERDVACHQEHAARALESLLGHEVVVDADVTPRLQLANVNAAARQADRALARLEALAPAVEQRTGLAERVDQLTRDQVDAATAARELEVGLSTGPGRRDALDARLRELEREAAARADVGAALAQAREVEAAALRVPAAEAAATRAADAHRRAVDAQQAATDRLQEVMRRRLAAAAAHLAEGLRDGEPCQVCGSPEHPAPAAGVADLPTDGDAEAARDEVDNRTRAREEAAESHRAADQVLARLQVEARGLPAAAATAETAALAHRLERVRLAAEQVTELAAERAALTQALERAAAELEAAVQHRVRMEAELSSARSALAELDLRLTEQLGEQQDLAAHLSRTQDRLAALAQAEKALDLMVDSSEALAGARRLAEKAAAEQGFPDVDAIRHAVLTLDDRDRLVAAVRTHETEHAVALRTLAEPEVRAAMESPAPDVATAEGLSDRTAEASRLADTEAARASERRHRLTALHAELQTALHAWAPLRRRYQVAESISALAEGKGDNTVRMALSAYVLAARLEQVVAAANEKFAPMTDQRFALEYTSDRNAKDNRGGLGLQVRDAWTGERRDPKTLSGGETFQASLALALGLAQVVTEEAGGLELQTLFVDEGFGSLDADSLDDVMDVLDGLRSGGRVVGVVSHVSALRDRITSRVVVDKGATGSTIRQTGG